MQAARVLTETEEMKPKARRALKDLIDSFDRWAGQIEAMPHAELAQLVLDESGYTEMWQKDKTAEGAGRLENLKELVRSMEEFENLAGFLEHIALVTEARGEGETEDAVSIMTLHSAKGLEFETVFLPGWEEGLFPHQRSLDENGRAGLEEERRLAYVGITRARRRAKIYFAGNRRIHGLWQSTVPSRFVNDLPPDHVEISEGLGTSGYGGMGRGGFGQSRFDKVETFSSTYSTPGWQRAQAQKSLNDAQARFTGRTGSQAFGSTYAEGRGGFQGRLTDRSGGGRTIDGELVAKSTGEPSRYQPGDRVFHLKFGYGDVVAAEGNKLTVQFDKAGEKKVVDSFVQAA